MGSTDHEAALNGLLDGLGELLSDLCAAPAEDSLLALDAALHKWWASFHALKQRLEDRTLSVALLALTKSGKSTLLNALIGQQLLPMNNVPETARICRIVHTPGAAHAEPYLVEPASGSSASRKASAANALGMVTARGEAAVRSRLQELNHAARLPSAGRSLTPATSLQTRHSSLPSVSSGGVDSLQTAGSIHHGDGGLPGIDSLAISDPGVPPVAAGLPLDKVISIHTPVAALLEYSGAETAGSSGASRGFRLQLLDTPGPNEAGEDGLRHQVERLLDGVDAAVYLLDYTKLKTQDEAGLFERLRAVNPALLARLAQRLFFVVNKVDAAEVSEGQDLEECREYVASLVTRQVDLPGFRLRPEQVLLLSARNALLSRLVLRGDPPAEVKQRFVQLAFGRFANPSLIPQEQLRSAALSLLEDSCIQELEGQVLGYLHTHAASLKRLALVDDLGRLLAEVRNVAASCAGALSRSADVLAARVAEVRGQLDTALAAFESVGRDADAIGEEVAREVRAHLHTLRGRLFAAIINTLDTSGGGGAAALAADLPQSAAAAAAACATPLSRRWRGVRERFLSIFTTRDLPASLGPSSNVTSSCGTTWGSGRGPDACAGRCDSAALLSAAGGAVARSQSKAELAALLVALHEDVTAQIHGEVCDFWGVMEAVAGARHSELLATLNTALSTLSAQVEGVVSRGLEVSLTPVTLRLDPPDASQFHADLDELLAKGVVETREKHIRVGKREVQERVLRRGGSAGICRWGDYWESVPRVRTVVETFTLCTYELVPTHITQHFITMIDQAIEVTSASLSAYVSQFVSQQLAEARHALQEYTQSYLLAMSAALDASTRGSQHRNAALAQATAFLDRLRDLAQERDALQRCLDAGVPRALGGPIAFNELDELMTSGSTSDEDGEDRAAPPAERREHGEENRAHPGSDGAQEGTAGATTHDHPRSPFDSSGTGLGAREYVQEPPVPVVDAAAAVPGPPPPAVLVVPSAPPAPSLPTPFAAQSVPPAPAPVSPSVPRAGLSDSGVWSSPRAPRTPTDDSSTAGQTAAMGLLVMATTASGVFPGSPDSHTTAGSTRRADAVLHAPLVGVGEAVHTDGAGVVQVTGPPGLPFDYASGFVTAMSSSHLEVSGAGQGGTLGVHTLGEAGSLGGEWDLVGSEEETSPRGNTQ